MQGVLLGFGIVLVLVAVGFAAAALVPGQSAAMQKGLTPVIYYITNPALMLTLLADTELSTVIGVYTPIALITAVGAGGAFALISRFVLRRGAAQTAAGAMAASYVNAGNIGLPIALYAVGSPAPVVAVLVAQLLVVAPAYLAVFEWMNRRNRTGNVSQEPVLWKTLMRSVTNPLTIATLAGAVLSLTGFHPPYVIWTPISMLGNASIPMLLLLFGLGVYGQRPFKQRDLLPDVLCGSAVKLVFMPLVAWATARFLFNVEGINLLGVVAMAALPTAQNVLLFTSQFALPTAMVRDVTLLSSFFALPALLLIAFLLE